MKTIHTSIKEFLMAVLTYIYDFWRFIRHAYLFQRRTNGIDRAHMLRISHALEKGMSLPNPRKGYGVQKSTELFVFLKEHLVKHGCDFESQIAVSSILSYLNFQKEAGYENNVLSSLEMDVRELLKQYPDLDSSEMPISGLRTISKKEILESAPNNPKNFFFSRQSVRQFKKGAPISEEILEEAAYMAQRAPSVCNRQSCIIRVYTNPDEIKGILEHQDGNSGFGTDCSAVAIISSDLNCFYKSAERNQGFMDGGLFAMSYVYALHSLGLGTCFLNWTMNVFKDMRMRKYINLPENEVLVTLIAIGHIPDDFQVAISPRRKLSDIYSLYK